MELTQRQTMILERLVQEHIRGKQPVSSELLVQKHRFGVSPATMRNEFMALGEAGYLAQPHVSAGRVPTTKAYRFFVDHFCDSWEIPPRFEGMLEDCLDDADDAYAVARKAAKLLASATGSVSIVSFRRPVFFSEGMREILDEPELHDASAFSGLLEALRVLEDSMDDLFYDGETRMPHVRIGEEHEDRTLSGFSTVTGAWGKKLGSGGVVIAVGPRRMRYEVAVPAVRRLAAYLSEINE